jgi:KipI family sensor histidine kinase inhibitor
VRVLPYGPAAALVECDSAQEVARACAALRRRGPEGVREVVPGALTVLLEGPAAPAVATELAGWTLREVPSSDGAEVTVDVRWDGADLGWVADAAGCSPEAVAAALESSSLTVAFSGFSPGFPYLAGIPPQLHVPRLDEPRASVPAGSLAVAAGYAGIYPRASPGGWRLLGTTDAVLWDTDRDPPALLPPGTRVRLRGVRR